VLGLGVIKQKMELWTYLFITKSMRQLTRKHSRKKLCKCHKVPCNKQLNTNNLIFMLSRLSGLKLSIGGNRAMALFSTFLFIEYRFVSTFYYRFPTLVIIR